jgi:hypothetical protein
MNFLKPMGDAIIQFIQPKNSETINSINYQKGNPVTVAYIYVPCVVLRKYERKVTALLMIDKGGMLKIKWHNQNK